MTWYKVSLFGWFVTIAHLLLSAFIIHGYIAFDEHQPAYYLYNGAFIIHFILLSILLWARFKKEKLFAVSKESKKLKRGFTLIELLIVISIIAILARFIIGALSDAREAARLARAEAEFDSIMQSLQLYQNEFGDFPDDTNRDIPPGLEAYLAPGIWPDAAWTGSVFDWDNWEDPDDPEQRILQISVRFCPIGQPLLCKFPEADWAEDFDINSAVYYCIEGACRSHLSRPIDHPGYCVNCPE